MAKQIPNLARGPTSVEKALRVCEAALSAQPDGQSVTE